MKPNQSKLIVRAHCSNARADFETDYDGAVDAMLLLAARRDDPRAWDMIRLVLEYDKETPEERVNIEQTLLEILHNEPILVPV